MKNKNFFKIGLIYFIAMICIAILFTLGSFGFITNEFWASFLIQIVVMFSIPLLLYSLLVSKSVKKTFKDTGFAKFSFKMLLISIALGFVLYFLNSFIATFFSSVIHGLGYESLSSSQSVTLDYKFLLKEFALTAVLPGICEEFLHRGIMLNAAKKHTNPRYCLIISSILFGFAHLNVNQFFYATILGFLIGIVAFASDSIWPCIIIHFMNNFLSGYFAYGVSLNWPMAKFIASVESFFMSNFVGFVLASVVSVLLLILAYMFLIKKLVFERTRIEMTQVLKELNILNTPLDLAQERINQINEVLTNSKSIKGIVPKDESKVGFKNQIFIISCFVLGAIITLCSFIWGLL